MNTATWAHTEFWGVELGDIRLERRLVEVAACIRDNPHGTLPQAVVEPMALKATYRMLSNPKVTHEKILQPHIARTRESCLMAGEYLLVEDTTALSFTQRAKVQGLGPLTGEISQGFLAHTNLALRVEQWSGEGEPEVVPVGLFGQECWSREEPEGTRAERKKAHRINKQKFGISGESDRWARAVAQTEQLPDDVRWSLVADRESDIFRVLVDCGHRGIGWVIRAAHPRHTTSEFGKVFETAAQGTALGRFTLALRTRPDAPARLAELEVRAIKTEIKAPRDLPGTHQAQPTTLVEVREVDPPEGLKAPLHWVLLTSWPCKSFEQARRVVGAYACRWLIEEYHKVLKTGTHIEDSQLSAADRIQALFAIHAVIAVKLLQFKLLANTHPDEPIEDNLLAPEALVILEKLHGKPADGWTNASTMRSIARMGGFLGRKHDGPPGWLSIWRGWLRLMPMVEGYVLALGHKNCG